MAAMMDDPMVAWTVDPMVAQTAAQKDADLVVLMAYSKAGLKAVKKEYK